MWVYKFNLTFVYAIDYILLMLKTTALDQCRTKERKMIDQTLTLELSRHIDSLTLAEAETMLTNLVSEMKRLQVNGESFERYRDEYNTLKRVVGKFKSDIDNAKCEELAKAVQAEYKALFPLSHTYARKEHIGDGWFLMVFLGDKESFENGIEHNDSLRHHYSFSVGEKGLCVTSCGVSIGDIKPTDIYTYCSRVKVAFRKKEGDLKKCVAGMKKHFQALRVAVDTAKPNLLERSQAKYAKF